MWVSRPRCIASWLCAIAVCAAACARIPALLRDLAPRRTAPLLKIGLTAPFEGRYREIGYTDSRSWIETHGAH